jgi:uncharacterized protein (TIGR02646 family)
MRSLVPTNLLPPTLAANGAGGKRAVKHEADRRVDPTARLTFPDHWNQPDVRGLLYARHGRVCAFCGCDLPRNDRGDVEHFRPKGKVEDDAAHGGYWWLAYELSNYLLSCSICNRVRKRDRFPLRPNARRRITYQRRQHLHTEARLFLHPQWDPVENWLRVQWQDPLCFVAPQHNLSAAARKRVQLVIDFFRLNQDVRLVRERRRVRDEVVKALDDGRINDARRFAIRFQPHSLVARQVLIDCAAQHLPSPDDELQWLLQDALDELLLALELEHEMGAVDDSQERLTKELLWTFAALWLEPLTGNPADVESLLQDADLTDIVRPFLDAFRRASPKP